jgi:transposase
MRGQLNEIQRLKQINTRLKNDNAKLREQVKRIPVLEKELKETKQELEKAFLLIEELQRIVFKRKKKKDKDDKNDNNSSGGSLRKKIERNASSYRRATPKEEEITDEVSHDFGHCSHCETELTKLKKLEFFTEDILPPEEWFKVLKKITRHWITTGYCSCCQKRVSSMPIPKQKTSLGENIRQLITFQFAVEQLSYSQIKDFSEGLLHLKLSDGEISHILEGQASNLESEYLALKERIQQSEAVHVDETGWSTPHGNQGNYAWVAASALSEEVIYALGQSRGKGNVEKLLGKNYSGIGITDGYHAYKNTFQKGKHALCWAHPHRKIRELTNSETLSKNKKKHCQKSFSRFSLLYEQVREVNARPFIREERIQAVEELKKVLTNFTRPHSRDPEKLAQIKRHLQEQQDCYFVCLLEPNVSPDNNKAERALRHLVIKRKKSFGSKTQKGADMLSIIYSVVMSLWRKSKTDFFCSYSQTLKPLA